ncbi:MAG TPA: DUF3303 family protein [Chitinophagaceae bacterium]|jgi:hypothetical protein|nr:DUF3303 family protein [Chitinophagaceae bacterium]HRG91404.1 DUF3303 family protein [Chitinophagaceae bacterium]
MHYMITERFHPGKVKALYQRFAEKGRMLPEGLEYVNSWVSEDLTVCWATDVYEGSAFTGSMDPAVG